MATSADTPTQAASQDTRKRKAWLLGLLFLLIVAGAGAWAWYSLVGRWHESTDDAYVNGNVVEITPLITGTVTSIGADDGDLVHAGQVLLQFDPADSEVALQAAEAKLARTVRQTRGLYSNVDSLKAQLQTRQAELQRPSKTTTGARYWPTAVPSPRKKSPTRVTTWPWPWPPSTVPASSSTPAARWWTTLWCPRTLR